MLSTTLKDYKGNYQANLSAFLDEYEDNNKTFFLEKELKIYQDYHNALTIIPKQLKYPTTEEILNLSIHSGIASNLKIINVTAYNDIVTELRDKNEIIDTNLDLIDQLSKDLITINLYKLENYIKSSTLILKLISQEYEEEIYNKVTAIESITDEISLPDTKLPEIDPRLDLWINNYEATNDYIHVPTALEPKRNWVTDKYKNYEERYYKSQIDICDAIFSTVTNDTQIKEIKTEYKNKLRKLRNIIPLPKTDINNLISEINNAFYRLEKFMKGSSLEYNTFYFNDAFTLLFNELTKFENLNKNNDALINSYYKLLNQIYYDYDKSAFFNTDGYENEDFNHDCNEIIYLASERYEDFNIDEDGNSTRISITDLVHNINNNSIKADYESFQLLKIEIDDFISKLEMDISQNYDNEKYLILLDFINLIKEDASNDMQNTLKSIPETDKIKFFQMMLPKIKEQLASLKEKHYNSEISNFLNKDVIHSITKTKIINISKSKKLADKWHALLYLIEVEVYEKKIPINTDGAFIKSEIEEIGKQRCNNSGQGFYRQVRDLKDNIKSNISVKRLFNNHWKEVIIDLSNNDEKIIKYLETYYK